MDKLINLKKEDAIAPVMSITNSFISFGLTTVFSSKPVLINVALAVGVGVLTYYICEDIAKKYYQRKINLMMKKLQIARRQLEQTTDIHDIQCYQQHLIKLQQQFIQQILDFDVKVVKRNKKHIQVIGPISAGKSSLLNYFLGTNLEAGVGQTTQKIQKVKELEKAVIYDSPGLNESYDIQKSEVLKELFCMDAFLVCYKNSILEVSLIIRILSALRKNVQEKSGKSGKKIQIYLVRTQCDLFEEKDAKTYEQQIQTDKQELLKMHNKETFVDLNYQIFAASSRRQNQFGDNQKIMDILNGQGIISNQNQQFEQLSQHIL